MERYIGINGLKTYAILGIIFMHILANGNYSFEGFLFTSFIPSFADLVFVFMMVSGFGMCCGYYDKIIHGKIEIGNFYKKRYCKIWPFFAFLCIIDLLNTPSLDSVYEVFANLTLCQGLLPNMSIDVIGVSWTLAVIFLFYIIFPFFCFLLANKKRAWIVFLCSSFFNFACTNYFFDTNHIVNAEIVGFLPRANFLYCSVYFVAGGIIFLYRKTIVSFVHKFKTIVVIALILVTVFYFIYGPSTLLIILISTIMLVYSLGCEKKGLLVNDFTYFFSKISFEIYLCHMLVFRLVDKITFLELFDGSLILYVLECILVVLGSIILSLYFNKALKYIRTKLINNKCK